VAKAMERRLRWTLLRRWMTPTWLAPRHGHPSRDPEIGQCASLRLPRARAWA